MQDINVFSLRCFFEKLHLVQNNITDGWESLRLVHAGLAELEAEKKLSVVHLLLLWVDGLPLF